MKDVNPMLCRRSTIHANGAKLPHKQARIRMIRVEALIRIQRRPRIVRHAKDLTKNQFQRAIQHKSRILPKIEQPPHHCALAERHKPLHQTTNLIRRTARMQRSVHEQTEHVPYCSSGLRAK